MRVTFPKGVRTVSLDDGDRAALHRCQGIANELAHEPKKYAEAKSIADGIETLLMKFPEKTTEAKAK